MKFINQVRKYYPTFTESELYLPTHDSRFCWVLEDIGRPVNVKMYGQTCIPEGVYRVSISKSTRWNKDMLLLSNTLDKSVCRDGVHFKGVRPHGGNDVEDTEGCPLVAYNSNHEGKVWTRASDDLFDIVKEWIDNGEIVQWVISSTV